MGKKSKKKKAKKAAKAKARAAALRAARRPAAKAKRTRPAAKAKRARPAAKRPTPKRTVKKPAAAKPTVKKPVDAKRAAASKRKDPMRALAKRIVDLTLAGDDAGTLALYADNVESVEMGMPPGVGIAALRQKFEMWRGMASDAKWVARAVCVDGPFIMVEWEGRVTLSGNGRTVSMSEVAVHEIKNGKIVRERFYYDPSVLQQAASAPAHSSSSTPS